jgi:hypothetical protein
MARIVVKASSVSFSFVKIMSELALPPPDEPNPDLEPEPDWKLYENAIAHIEESYENCTVTRNHRPVGRRSGVKRQVDVWLEATVGDNHVVTVAIECRRYEKPVTIKDIDAFCGFLDDVGANKGVMISHSGYTGGAEKRAQAAGIELRMLTIEQAEDFDWEEFVQDSCQMRDCFGTITWHFSDGASEAGYCSRCGSFHIRCGQCESVDWYNGWDIESCSSCPMKWRLEKEKGMICGIKELPPEVEPEEEEEQ